MRRDRRERTSAFLPENISTAKAGAKLQSTQRSAWRKHHAKTEDSSARLEWRRPPETGIERLAGAIEPACATQPAVIRSVWRTILAPFPNISAKVVKTERIGRKRA